MPSEDTAKKCHFPMLSECDAAEQIRCNLPSTLALCDKRHRDEQFEQFRIGISFFYMLGYIQVFWFAAMAANFLTSVKPLLPGSHTCK